MKSTPKLILQYFGLLIANELLVTLVMNTVGFTLFNAIFGAENQTPFILARFLLVIGGFITACVSLNQGGDQKRRAFLKSIEGQAFDPVADRAVVKNDPVFRRECKAFAILFGLETLYSIFSYIIVATAAPLLFAGLVVYFLVLGIGTVLIFGFVNYTVACKKRQRWAAERLHI